MINILGKVNKYNFKEFTKSDFLGYEVFLGSEEDFKVLPKIMRRLNVVSVHEPARNFNLCSRKKIGEDSFQLMVRLLTVLKKNGFKGVMVIHGALFDETIQERNVCLKILAKRIDRLSVMFPQIKISMETDILFFNQILDNRALLALPEDFIDLKKYVKSRLYITLDFEHSLISALFKDFVDKNKQSYRRIKNLADLETQDSLKVKAVWQSYLVKNQNRFDEIFLTVLDKYEKLKISIIHFHLSPSDMLNYWYDEKFFVPLRGEHLSVGQKEDKLNYRLIKSRLPRLSAERPINVVVEIWPKEAGRYVSQLKKSGKLLKKIWRIKK